MHGKTIVQESVSGKQLLDGQQVQQLDDKTLFANDAETLTRWIQHFALLFNQPGEVGLDIDEFLPTHNGACNVGLAVDDTPGDTVGMKVGTVVG